MTEPTAAGPHDVHSAADGGNGLSESRPWKKSLCGIFLSGMLLTGLLYVAVVVLHLLRNVEHSMTRALEYFSTGGDVVLEHIGWALGANLTVLLAFYAIVIGGQIVESSKAPETRRNLGFVAQWMAMALVPALCLILVACFKDPAQSGALFVIVPTTTIVFFLAVQLGGFVVFSDADRLKTSAKTREDLRVLLESLQPRGRRKAWQVLVANVGVGVGICLAISGAYAGAIALGVIAPGQHPALVFVWCTVSAVLLPTIAFAGIRMFRTEHGGLEKFVVLPVPILWAIVTLEAFRHIFDGNWALGTGIAAVLIFNTVTGYWPRRHMNRFMLNWTIQGAATAYAAGEVAQSYVTSSRNVRRLTKKIQERAACEREFAGKAQSQDQPSFLDRLIIGMQAFRDGRA